MKLYILQSHFNADQRFVWTELKQGAKALTGQPMMASEFLTFSEMELLGETKNIEPSRTYTIVDGL